MRRKLAMFFVLAFSGCAPFISKSPHGVMVTRGEDLREITADSKDTFYRGAFEICRSQTATGFELVQAPVEREEGKNKQVDGLIRCKGAIDPTLAQMYGGVEAKDQFAVTKGPLPGRTYFKITGPHLSE